MSNEHLFGKDDATTAVVQIVDEGKEQFDTAINTPTSWQMSLKMPKMATPNESCLDMSSLLNWLSHGLDRRMTMCIQHCRKYVQPFVGVDGLISRWVFFPGFGLNPYTFCDIFESATITERVFFRNFWRQFGC
jgi:hypothetical protein